MRSLLHFIMMSRYRNLQTLPSFWIRPIKSSWLENGNPQTKLKNEAGSSMAQSNLIFLELPFFFFIFGAFSSFLPLKALVVILTTWGILGVLHPNFPTPIGQSLNRTLEGLLETLQIALVSTLFAVVISIVLSVGAARTIAPLWLLWPTRMLLNMIRTIPKFALGPASCCYRWLQSSCWCNCPHILQCWLSRKVFQ